MATRRPTRAADDAADAVSAAGRRASSKARRAGDDVAAAIDRSAGMGAAGVRRAARRGTAAYDAAIDEVDVRVGSLEDQIRRNPLAAAGAALLIGVVLGRFVL